MKIIYILSGTISTGGATKSFMTLLDGVINEGHDVSVIVPDKGGIYSLLVERKIKTFALPYRFHSYPVIYNWKSILFYVPLCILWLLRNLYSLYRLKKITASFKPDLIHTNSGVVGIGYLVSRCFNIPHIYHIREYADKDFSIHHFPSKKSFLKKLNSENSYNICITKDIQKYYKQTNHDNSVVVYNGIDCSWSDMPSVSQRPYFLYAGRIERAKGVKELVCAYREYVKKAEHVFPLWLVGNISEPNYWNEILEYVNANGISEYIIYKGVSSNMCEFYSQAKALIVSSSSEGFGRCMPEAMFNSCLVIGRDAAGTKEQFDNGFELTGKQIGFRYNYEHELTDILYNISCHNDSDYDDLRRIALDVVKQLYSPDVYIKHILQFYKKCVKK